MLRAFAILCVLLVAVQIDIPIELWKAAGEEGVDILWRICKLIWTKGEWPKDWCRAVFIPIPKKGNLKECSNYRTISLIVHASKVLLKIIKGRIKLHYDREMAEEQAGFVEGKGTREQIVNIRIIIEKCRDQNIPLYMCFIDYAKAFDWASHRKLWDTMEQMGSHYPTYSESVQRSRIGGPNDKRRH